MIISDKVKIWFQLWAPKHLITKAAGRIASAKLGRFTTTIIRTFIKVYKINMEEALHSNPADFETFNDFFVRELKEGVRPIDADEQAIVYPADACVGQFGSIDDVCMIQAKGHDFSVRELLGGDEELYKNFINGQLARFYLSPSDYHRVHMPCDGTLRQMIYVPGELFSVNPLTAENIPGLFSKNERVVCIFDTDSGPMAQILVGAIIVGSIEVVWSGTITPPRDNKVHQWSYPAEGMNSVKLKKGEEMGSFKLGSTVINLFAKDKIVFNKNMSNGNKSVVGKAFAHSLTTKSMP